MNKLEDLAAEQAEVAAEHEELKEHLEDHEEHGEHEKLFDHMHGHVHELSPSQNKFLVMRNIAVVAAALLFGLSLIDVGILHDLSYTLKAVAYIIGAGAYMLEYLMMTDGFKIKPPKWELFMPNVFGIMYIILGISYILH